MNKYPVSATILDRNRRFIPGGVVSTNRAVEPEIVFERGQGAYIWDVEGNRYIDYGVFGTMERKVRLGVLVSIRRQNPIHGCFADAEPRGDSCAGCTLSREPQNILPPLRSDGFASLVPTC